jgi:hypothetical protein
MRNLSILFMMEKSKSKIIWRKAQELMSIELLDTFKTIFKSSFNKLVKNLLPGYKEFSINFPR